MFPSPPVGTGPGEESVQLPPDRAKSLESGTAQKRVRVCEPAERAQALVIEGGNALSQPLQSLGYFTTTYSHHAVTTAQTSEETGKISNGACQVVAMTIPTAREVPLRQQARTRGLATGSARAHLQAPYAF